MSMTAETSPFSYFLQAWKFTIVFYITDLIIFSTLYSKPFYCRQDDGHLSTDGSTIESEDEWETASGESEDDEDLAVDIMDLAAAAAGEGGDITADQAGHTTDEGAESVDREALHEARNKMNEILSNSNPRKVFKCDYLTVTLFCLPGD